MRLWLFDFDGTLSPLVADRNAAVLHPSCAVMLKELSRYTAEHVAIVSSRSLEDILQRVPLDDVIVGGSSGMEWQLPGGCRISPGADKKNDLQARRKELMPQIEKFGRKLGIEIEDKQWSVAIHFSKSGQMVSEDVYETISAWAERENVSIHRGPNVFEIQLISDFNKSVGASFIAQLLKFDSKKDDIIYAGDDENDAVAMRWVLDVGGTAIMVGKMLDVAGALYVHDQQALVETVEKLRRS